MPPPRPYIRLKKIRDEKGWGLTHFFWFQRRGKSFEHKGLVWAESTLEPDSRREEDQRLSCRGRRGGRRHHWRAPRQGEGSTVNLDGNIDDVLLLLTCLPFFHTCLRVGQKWVGLVKWGRFPRRPPRIWTWGRILSSTCYKHDCVFFNFM